jgi:type VI secretion system secreted protein Hcp
MPNMIYAKFGSIEGSCVQAKRQGYVEIVDMDHQIEIPVSTTDGTPTGTRRHRAMKLTAAIDAATPEMMKNVCTLTPIAKVDLKYYAIVDGTEVNYFTVVLENAKVTAVRMWFPNVHNEDTKNYKHMVTYDLRYEKITWVYTDGNKETSDTWLEPEQR